ncbi:MAG: cytochrome C oxidase subunit IV family protein [Planctomycetes bacterium]|nr:cytochrome C oxidase subunit IV family protein [Planctomycetota bacterium]
MSSSHSRKTYIAVFFALGVLTLIEIWIPGFANKYGNSASVTQKLFAQYNAHWSTWALYALSIAKAGIVGAYFMHLKHETKWLKFIAILPAIAAFYAFVLGAETLFRFYMENNPTLMSQIK